MAIFGRNSDNLESTVNPDYRTAEPGKRKKKKNAPKAADDFVNSLLPPTEGVNPYELTHRPTAITYDRSVYGPHDRGEMNIKESDYIDLGAVLIYPYPEMSMSLELEESTGRIISVSLDFEHSTLQLQAFSAPRKEPIWDEIRRQIITSVESQGGATSEVRGLFGVELLANLPVSNDPSSQNIYRQARFVGMDGPRWFLRGVFAGAAAQDEQSAAALEDVFRSIIVRRENAPLPPKELLPLKMPQEK